VSAPVLWLKVSVAFVLAGRFAASFASLARRPDVVVIGYKG
jgi:hypothetical protein